MEEDSTAHGRGRPQKFPGEGARISHSLRLTPAMAERLRVAAQAGNRTLGEEMELRINRSFEQEDQIERAVREEVSKRAALVTALKALSSAQADVDRSFAQLNVARNRREAAAWNVSRSESEFYTAHTRKYYDIDGKEVTPDHHYEVVRAVSTYLERARFDLVQADDNLFHAQRHYELELSKLEVENANYRKTADIGEGASFSIMVRGFHDRKSITAQNDQAVSPDIQSNPEP